MIAKVLRLLAQRRLQVAPEPFDRTLDRLLDGRKYRRLERSSRTAKGNRTRQHRQWLNDPIVHSLMVIRLLPMTAAQKKDARDRLMMRDGVGCCYCRKTLQFKRPDAPNYATIEHVVALAFGGTHELKNLKLCCLGCNAERGKKTSRTRSFVVSLVASNEMRQAPQASTPASITQ